MDALGFIRSMDITVTWSDVQDMPENWVDVWQAFGNGEARARKEKTTK